MSARTHPVDQPDEPRVFTPQPLGRVACRADDLTAGAVVLGTAAGDTYPQPRTVLAIALAPEHARRMTAYRITWDNARPQVYYGDTVLWVRKETGA